MWDFLTTTGVAGIGAIALVTLVIFVIAEPGSEISVLSIKFRKRPKRAKKPKFKKAPNPPPEIWLCVLDPFLVFDSEVLSIYNIVETFDESEFSKLQVMKAIDEMKEHGLVKVTGGGTHLELLELGRDIVIEAHETLASKKSEQP